MSETRLSSLGLFRHRRDPDSSIKSLPNTVAHNPTKNNPAVMAIKVVRGQPLSQLKTEASAGSVPAKVIAKKIPTVEGNVTVAISERIPSKIQAAHPIRLLNLIGGQEASRPSSDPISAAG